MDSNSTISFLLLVIIGLFLLMLFRPAPKPKSKPQPKASAPISRYNLAVHCPYCGALQEWHGSKKVKCINSRCGRSFTP